MILSLWFSAALAAQTTGVAPEWEIRDLAAKLEKQAMVIDGLLAQFKPEEWVKQGAPGAYVDQLAETRQFNSYLAAQAQNLEREPAKLSVVLDTFLRLEHLQSLLDSIEAGARHYQNPSLADLLASAIGQAATMREPLKEYTRALAVDREKEWEIANQEAQRCRVTEAKRPPSPPAKKAAPAKQ